MPSTSEKQHKAMCAAAHGKSKSGIPKKVGKEFCHADKGKKFKKKHGPTGGYMVGQHGYRGGE